MNADIELLKRIRDLPVPRDFNPMPDWVNPHALDSLIRRGHIDCLDVVHDEQGVLCIALRVDITDSGYRLIDSEKRQAEEKEKMGWARVAAIAGALTFILGAIYVILKEVSKSP